MRQIAIALSFPIVAALLTLALAVSPTGALADNPFVPDPATPVLPPATPDGALTGNGVSEVPPEDVICDTTIDFEGQGGAAPGTNYDGILVSGGASFTERFVGQTRTTVFPQGAGLPFDALDDVASGPLASQTGDPGQNVNVLQSGTDTVNGLGPLGYPDFDAIGEGSLAILFPCDQSELTLEVIGGDNGTATVQFFRANGTHIGNVVIATPLANVTHGFQRAGGIRDIRGVSIYNDDPAGIGYDNICYTRCATPVEPGTWGQIKARFKD